MLSPTQRFSSRVENYVKYRPSYPPAVLDLLRARCGLRPAAAVADVGSGTGILTELLLEAGADVFAIEPNDAMRAAAEKLLSGRARFHSLCGRAEATTLPESTMDLIVAGQAFHWFEVKPTRAEFSRILKAGGWVALIWNQRRRNPEPFLADYHALLQRYSADYAQIDALQTDERRIGEFFEQRCEHASFPNQQVLDLQGLQGRLMSGSYAPEPGDPQHAPMLAELRNVFERHQREGKVVFPYDTRVYFGRLRCP